MDFKPKFISIYFHLIKLLYNNSIVRETYREPETSVTNQISNIIVTMYFFKINQENLTQNIK
jgi:hypothetical protein